MSELKQSSVALLEKAIDDKIRKAKSKQGTTLATVTRVDNDGTTWVHVYGGADETPVRHMTSSASVGDVINVTFSGLSCSGVGNVSSPSATQKQVQQLSSETASAIKGVMGGVLQIKTLVAEKVATKELDAEIANILTASIQNATISTLNAMYADINAANINTAEIQDAWVDKLLVQTNLLANDGTVFTLDAVQVDAANITTGTLDVRRLIITREETDPSTGELVEQKYLVNIDPETSQPTYEKLDGNIVEPRSIGADKIEAHAITAEELTIQNIVGTGGWINLANGTFAYGNPLTGQGITWDGSSLNISGSVRIGSSSKALSDMLTADDVTVTQNQTQTGYDVDIAGNTFSLVNGEDGQPGATGPTAQWYYGTALTHTSGTATLATSSTAGVVVGAMYLNKSTSLCYKCTAISGTTATWTYAGNLTDGVIDNIGVGGRNLLLGTGTAKTSSSFTLNSSNYAIYDFYSLYAPYNQIAEVNGIVTVSFDWSCTSTGGNFHVECGTVTPYTWGTVVKATGTRSATSNYVDVSSSNVSGHVSISFKATQAHVSAADTLKLLRIRVDGADWSGKTITLSNAKAEKGNVATDWTPAPEDFTAYVDAVQIGGRNLLLQTEKLDDTSYWNRYKITSVTGGQSDPSGGTGAFLVTPNATSWYLSSGASGKYLKEVGETYTASVWLRADSATTCNICVRYLKSDYADGTSATATTRMTVDVTTSWQRFSVTGTLTTAQTADNFWIGQKTNVPIYVYHPKQEKGNKPTDWTPAPEDMATTGDVAATQPLVIGTQAAATRFWTGNCPELSSLAQGQHITYFLPYAYKKETAQSKGITAEELVPTETVTTEYSNDWLKLTLSDGSDTGWVPIYYQGTTRLTSHYGAGMVIPLVYREGYSSSIPRGWWGASQYNVNQIDRRQHNGAVKAAVDITKYAICGGTSAGYRKLAAGVTFDLSYPILYLNANTASGQEYAIAANATSTAFYEACPSVTFTNTATIQSGAANKTLYVKGTVSGNTFTVASSNFLTTVESSQETAQTEFYIPIGLMTSGTVGYFATSKDLYAYLDGKFRQVTPTEIVSTHKVYYRTDTELATSAARQAIKPTAWVSESAGIVYNQWTPSLPPVAAYASSGTDDGYVKYPYVYMCEQRKRLDGTVDCTAVVPHEAGLVVDGDAIIDGTVSANKLVARSITANYIDATDLQVDSANIKGQLSVNQIDTSGISLTKTQVVDLDSDLASLSGEINAQASALENSVGGINQAIESTNTSLSNLTQTVTNVTAELDGRIKTITDSIDIDADHISLITQTTSGGTTEKMEARLTSSKLAFVQDGKEVAYIGNESLNITNAVVQDTLTLGDFAFVPLASGGLALKWMGN